MKTASSRKLLNSIRNLKKSRIKDLVDSRMLEFKENSRKLSGELFNELCFCILTANFNAIKCMKIQEEIGIGFLTLPELELSRKLEELGHRYPRRRAKYIVEARKYASSLKNIIGSLRKEESIREWLVKNIKGIGFKEASHFLRNIGYRNLAIIDFHIIDLLTRYELIERPRTLTKSKYLEIEDLLRTLSNKSGLSLAELDLYLWYLETGKVLK